MYSLTCFKKIKILQLDHVHGVLGGTLLLSTDANYINCIFLSVTFSGPFKHSLF